MRIDWNYVTKRWVVVTAVIVLLFIVFVIAVRFFDSSGGTPAEGLENQPDVIEGRPKQPSLEDANQQPQTNVGGIEEYRQFETQN